MKSLTKEIVPRIGLRAVIALLFTLVLASCTTAPAAVNLTDGTWQWVDWTDTTGTTTVPNPENYTLTFNSDGTFTGLADCNSFSGTYTQDGDNFTILPGPTTLMACPEGSLDTVFTQTLAQVDNGTIDGNNDLILTTADGLDMRFTNPTAPVAEAAGGFLGLPWWAWLLLLLLLALILWWLFSRNNEPEPAPTVTRTVAPPPPPAAPVAAPVVDTDEGAEFVGVYEKTTDDLTRIEGIGPKISSVLAAAGITTFRELSNTSVDELQRILAAADLRGSFGDPTTWAAQAEMAADGRWDDLDALQQSLKGGRTG